MNISSAAYRNTDKEYREICNFLNNLSAKDPFMMWESGRMNFWRYNVHANKDPLDPFFEDNVYIWRDGGMVIGLCISEYGRNDLFMEVLPEYLDIYPDIFHWVENIWAHTRKFVDIDVFGDDTQKISRLKAHGFSFLRHFENKRIYDLRQIDLGYHLESGFTIQTFSELPDYAGKVALVQSAFENPNYSEKNLKGLISSPDYMEEYDLMVVTPDRQPVAYCVGWQEQAREHCGYIEPVGTHAGYRQRGFAKAVIRECFARMKANGIQIVEIASSAEPDISNILYDSLSPQTKREVHKYGMHFHNLHKTIVANTS